MKSNLKWTLLLVFGLFVINGGAWASFSGSEEEEADIIGGGDAVVDNPWSEVGTPEDLYVRISNNKEKKKETFEYDKSEKEYKTLVATVDGTIRGVRSKFGGLKTKAQQLEVLRKMSILVLPMKFEPTDTEQQTIVFESKEYTLVRGDIVRFAVELPDGKNVTMMKETKEDSSIKAFADFTFMTGDDVITWGQYFSSFNLLLGDCKGEWPFKKK